jgi:phosphohistidine phosphatase
MAIRDHLEASDLRPNLVLCSSARRTRETLALVLPALGRDLVVRVEPGLYTFSARDVLARIRDIDDGVHSALVIGHNPATEELARMLSSDGGEGIGPKYPTAALAVLELAVDGWGDAGRSEGSLVAFVTPKELGSS